MNLIDVTNEYKASGRMFRRKHKYRTQWMYCHQNGLKLTDDGGFQGSLSLEDAIANDWELENDTLFAARKQAEAATKTYNDHRFAGIPTLQGSHGK